MVRRDFLRGAIDPHPGHGTIWRLRRETYRGLRSSELSCAYVHIRIGACALSSYSDVFTSEAAVVWVLIVLARVAPVDVIGVQRGVWQ